MSQNSASSSGSNSRSSKHNKHYKRIKNANISDGALAEKERENLFKPDHVESTKKQSSKTKSKTTSDPKQTTPQRRQRSKKFKEDAKQPKLTSFLHKKNEENEKTSKPERKPLDIIVTKANKRPHDYDDVGKDKKPSSSAKSKKLNRSSSFEKYGMRLPSFEKILEDQKKYEDYKHSVEEFDSIDKSIFKETFLLNIPETSQSGKTLDCKHLSSEQLDRFFKQHRKTLKAIKKGRVFSERHNKFYKFDTSLQLTTEDLSYSTSLMVLSERQRDHLMDLMEESLEKKDNRNFGYLFKVLLPELCLLIFMDVHNMEKREAEEYLDKCPVSAV